MRRALVVVTIVTLLGACSEGRNDERSGASETRRTPGTAGSVQSTMVKDAAGESTVTSRPVRTAPASTRIESTTTFAPATVTTPPTPITSAATISAPVTDPTVGATEPSTSDAVTTTPYVVPVADADHASWGTTHSSYPATDIFVGCGAPIVSPVNGTLTEVRRVNSWDASVDNPATRVAAYR